MNINVQKVTNESDARSSEQSLDSTAMHHTSREKMSSLDRVAAHKDSYVYCSPGFEFTRMIVYTACLVHGLTYHTVVNATCQSK